MVLKFKKKRYWLIALLCLEIATIPFGVGLIGHIKNLRNDYVIAVMIDEQPGQKRFAVASKEAFFIKAKDFTGPIIVSAQNEKTIGIVTFGENAHEPIPARHCSIVTPDDKTIYQSEKGTIAAEGHISTQAIVVTIQYDASELPKIDFVSGEDIKAQPSDFDKCLVKLV